MASSQRSTALREVDRLSVMHVIPGIGIGGGAERSLVESAPLLLAAGVDLTVVRFHERSTSGEEALRDAGATVLVARGRTGVGRTLALRRLIRRLGPTVVHTSLYEADVAGRVAAVGLHAVVLNSIVNMSYSREAIAIRQVAPWKLTVVRLVDKLTARLWADWFVANSVAGKEDTVTALGVDPKRVTVIPRGREPGRLGSRSQGRRARVRAQLGLAEEPVLISVGRQDPQKAHVQIVRALPALLAAEPDLKVLLVGLPGRCTEQLVEEAAELGVTNAVLLLGHREDVADLLAAADVFVFPSLVEGMPGAVIEAMALGLPIVASSIAPVREVVDETCAVLVPPEDPAALGVAILGVLGDPSAAASIGEHARERYLADFTVDVAVARLAALYGVLAKDVGLTWTPMSAKP